MRILRPLVFVLLPLVSGSLAVWWSIRRDQASRPAAAQSADATQHETSAPQTAAPISDLDPAPLPQATDFSASSDSDSGSANSDHFDRLTFGRRWSNSQPAELAAFRHWTDRYRATYTAENRAALEVEGVALARARRPVMLEVIKRDPERALEWSLPAAVRHDLPEAVRAEVETRVSGTGDFAVMPIESLERAREVSDSVERWVQSGPASYKAHVYGRRLNQQTKYGVSLHGIALDGHLALFESPLRVLEPGETAHGPIEDIVLATSRPAAKAGEAAMVNTAPPLILSFGGQFWKLADPNSLGPLEHRLIELELHPGPDVPVMTSAMLREPPTANAAPNAWTTGTKQVLFLRVDFEDRPGEPVSFQVATDVMENDVRPYFEKVSYGLTTLVSTVSSKVYRLPRTAASYAAEGNHGKLHADATGAASVDFDSSAFDRIIVAWKNLQDIPGNLLVGGARAEVGGKRIFIGMQDFDWAGFLRNLVPHELGHTYGLVHANLWQVADGNPLSPNGAALEYGDPFDAMGLAGARFHFNHRFKNQLGWLPDAAVTHVTTSGVYRVYRFDDQFAPRDQPLALRIFRDSVRSYWVGYRQTPSENTAMRNGAVVLLGFEEEGSPTWFIDVNTPGTDPTDGTLTVGRSLSDPQFGVTLRPVARGGDAPAEFIDVEVTLTSRLESIVAAWGFANEDYFSGTKATVVPMGLANVTAISASGYHCLALKADGTVVTWGRDPLGRDIYGILAVPAGLSNVVSIVTGSKVSGAVKSDGTIALWGSNSDGQLDQPPGLVDVRQLAIGFDHVLALKTDGTVVAWGGNSFSQATVPAGLNNVVSVAATANSSLALKNDGTVVRWGVIYTGVAIPANLSDVIAICGGQSHFLALKSDGTVAGWGGNASGQALVPAGLNGVSAIAAGGRFSTALKTDGTLVSWGENTAGQTEPPSDLLNVRAIASGDSFSLALLAPPVAPTIDVQPVSQTVNAGENATFSVMATGAGPLTLQWQRLTDDATPWVDLSDTAGINGTTTRSLTVISASAAMHGHRFRVVASRSGGNAVSDVVTLNVISIPTITAPPVGGTVALGAAFSFSVDASGTAPLSYQWRFNGAPISGAIGATYVIDSVRASDSGSYSVTVSNIASSVTSAGATLTVDVPASIVTQPATQTAAFGSSVIFTVAVSDPAATGYQWRKNGFAIPGATGASLVLPSTQANDGGFYDVVITRGITTVVSGTARLTVHPAAYTDLVDRAVDFAPRFETTGAFIYASVVAPDGKIFIGGDFSRINGVPCRGVARLNADGSFDATFGPVVVQGGIVRALARQADGRLIIGGDFTFVGGVVRNCLARLNADGSLDAGYNNGAGINSSVYALALQTDGKVVVGGDFSTYSGVGRNRIARLDATGALDTTFDPGSGFDYGVQALAVQSDGSVLVGGSFTTCAGVARGRIARLTSSGALDTSFNPGTGFDNSVLALAVQADGKVFVGGNFTTYNGAARVRLARLASDGTLDVSFNSGMGFNSSVQALALQPDGGIIAAGLFSSYAGVTRRSVARVTSDGTLDSSFGSATTILNNAVQTLALQADGRIVVGGFFTSFGSVARSGLARLGSNGELDPTVAPDMRRPGTVFALERTAAGAWLAGGSFDLVDEIPSKNIVRLTAAGAVDTTFATGTGFNGNVYALAMQPDGKVVVGGSFVAFAGGTRQFVARLAGDGTLDTTFAPGTGFNNVVTALVVQPDGKIVAGGGFTTFGGTTRNRVARLAANGSLDTSFNPGVGPNSAVQALLVQPDGRIVAGGAFTTFGGTTRNRIARLAANGSLETAFNSGAGFNATVAALALQPDGRIVVVGSFNVYAGITRRYVACLGADGALDTTFGTTSGFDNAVSSVCLQVDGKVVVGGNFSSFASTPRSHLARLNADGALDTGFSVPALPFRGIGTSVNALAYAPDGTLLAGGNLLDFSGGDAPALVALVPDLQFTAQPADVVLIVGANATFTVAAIGTSAPTFQWQRSTDGGATWSDLADGNGMSGATTASLSIASMTPTMGGQRFRVVASNIVGNATSNTATLAPAAATITTQPVGVTMNSGGSVTLTVVATGAATLTYQWRLNGVDIPGANSATFTLPSVQFFHAGNYTVVVGGPGGASVPSNAATLAVTAPPLSNARLLNLSTRAEALTGDDVLIPGFVVAGTDNKRLLIRAVGPTLGKEPFNLGGVLADPRMRLLRRNPTTQAFDEIAANDNWGTNANAGDITTTAANLFAFGFNDALEAALLMDLAPGEYTVIASGVNNLTGLAIVELYDADAGSPGSRLINISNRGFAGIGAQVMIPGFVVSSEGPKTLLVRVVGPTLSSFGVAGTMTDPKLEVFPGGASTPILANDNWSDNSDAAYTAQIAQQLLAFPLNVGSKDAAFVVTLQPGSYTVIGSSAVLGGTGVVLVEVYVVP